ncbi:MAG: class I SAM-dependent methyltransferase [bacterium]
MEPSIECISCGSREFTIVGFNSAFNNRRNVVRCNICGLAVVYPLPGEPEIAEFYAQEYTSKFKSYYKNMVISDTLSLFHNFFLSMRIRQRLGFLAQNNISLRGKKVLEIGSGNGAFLYALKKERAQVFGIELSRSEVKSSCGKFGIMPFSCSVKELSLHQKEDYDLVFAYHVLEHLRDPLGEMMNIRQLIKKGGFFIGEIPYTPQAVDSFSLAIKKSVFDNIHLVHFNVKSVSNLLAKTGFQDINVGRLGLNSMVRRIYPQANLHYLHPSYEKPLAVRFFSFLEGVELCLKNILGRPTMGLQQMKDPDTEWQGPNDWISFLARG